MISSTTHSQRTVHPRIRGERMVPSAIDLRGVGSSPHTRGTRDPTARHVDMFRFIPAYAGNAAGQLSVSKVCTVHPRIRGERARDRISGEREDGSSPHTRGTRWHGLASPDPPRFIPAYAGNARYSRLTGCDDPVHPRIRGERVRDLDVGNVGSGSSPHTRGTQG